MKEMTNITVRLRKSDIEKIKVIADKKERYPTELIRMIIERYLDEYYF